MSYLLRVAFSRGRQQRREPNTRIPSVHTWRLESLSLKTESQSPTDDPPSHISRTVFDTGIVSGTRYILLSYRYDSYALSYA